MWPCCWGLAVHHGFGICNQLLVLVVVSLVPFLLQQLIATGQDGLEGPMALSDRSWPTSGFCSTCKMQKISFKAVFFYLTDDSASYLSLKPWLSTMCSRAVASGVLPGPQGLFTNFWCGDKFSITLLSNTHALISTNFHYSSLFSPHCMCGMYNPARAYQSVSPSANALLQQKWDQIKYRTHRDRVS